MSQIPTNQQRVGVAGPPAAIGPASGLAALGGVLATLGTGSRAVGQTMASEGEAMRRAEVSAAMSRTRSAYLAELDRAELAAQQEADPQKAAELYRKKAVEARSAVLGPDGPGATLAGSDFAAVIDADLTGLEVPYQARVDRSVRAKQVDRAVAGLETELNDLTDRAAASDDPLLREVLFGQIRSSLEDGVASSVVSARQAAELERRAEAAIVGAQLDRDARMVADLAADGGRIGEMVAGLRAAGARIGVDAEAVDAGVRAAVVDRVRERVSAGDFVSAAAAIEGSLAAGVLAEGEAAELSEGVREGFAQAGVARVHAALREIRAGRETGDGLERVQNMIDTLAPVIGEKPALDLQVAFNNAVSDEIGKVNAAAKLRAKEGGLAALVEQNLEKSMRPGFGGFIDTSAKEIPVGSGSVTISEKEQQQALAAAAVARYADQSRRLMSEDPAERADALADIMPESADPGRPLTEGEANVVARVAALRWSMNNGIVFEPLRRQMKLAAAQGRGSLERAMATGEALPEDWAYPDLYKTWRILQDESVGVGEYLSGDEQRVMQEIDRQYRYGAQAGDFAASAVAAVNSLRRRAERGTPTDERVIPDELLGQAMDAAVSLSGVEGVFGRLGNLAMSTGDIWLDVMTFSPLGKATGVYRGTEGRVLPRFATSKFGEAGSGALVTNASQVKEWFRQTIAAVSESTDDMESAAALAVERFRANHLIINRRAVYAGSDAMTGMVRAVHQDGEFDRIINRYWKSAGGMEGIGVEKADLEIRPEQFGDPSRWRIVDGTTGIPVAEGVLGVDLFDLASLHTAIKRRQAERAAERSRDRRDEFDLLGSAQDAVRSRITPLLPPPKGFVGGEGEIQRPLTDEEIEWWRKMNRELNGGGDG